MVIGARRRRHLCPGVRGPGRPPPVIRHGTCAAPALAHRAIGDGGGPLACQTPTLPSAPHSRGPWGTGSACARPALASVGATPALPASAPTPLRSTATVGPPRGAGSSAI